MRALLEAPSIPGRLKTADGSKGAVLVNDGTIESAEIKKKAVEDLSILPVWNASAATDIGHGAAAGNRRANFMM